MNSTATGELILSKAEGFMIKIRILYFIYGAQNRFVWQDYTLGKFKSRIKNMAILPHCKFQLSFLFSVNLGCGIMISPARVYSDSRCCVDVWQAALAMVLKYINKNGKKISNTNVFL